MTKQNEKGFTLTELLVVIFITGVISTVFLVNYRSGNKNLTLQRAAHQLAQDIRRAQSMAMAPGEIDVNGTPTIPNGYGIYIQTGAFDNPQTPNPSTDEKESYILFADLNNNNRYNGGDEYLDNIKFEFGSGVYIEQVRVDGHSPPIRSFLNIFFSPPDPIIRIISSRNPPGDWGETNQIRIILGHHDLTNKVNLIIHKSGLVEIQ